MSLASIYFCEDIRALEALALALPEAPRLMQRAGLAAAHKVRAMLDERGSRVLVAAGPGNNGGDAFELAAHLKRWFYRVEVVFLGDAAKLSADARRALEQWHQAGGSESHSLPDAAGIARNYDLVVDGLFGIGLTRALQGQYADAVNTINQSGRPVLALDIPSGIDSDSGAVMGCAIRATQTLTFIALKPGLLTLDGPDNCGVIEVTTLGLEVEALHAPQGRLLQAGILREALSRRGMNFHKGNAGDVAVLGGAPGMVGAALLAGRAALLCGAGRVHVGLIDEDAPRVDPGQPELMLRRAHDLSLAASVVAAGPGLGQDAAAGTLLANAIGAACPLVLDADALNLVARDAALAQAVTTRSAATLLTPHPAEAARLLATGTAAIQSNRIAAARQIAQRYRATVALKGNGTIVATADGRWWINSSGHPGMASAGMGDALTGMVASMIAQGAEPVRALCAAVWLHGAAGDALAVKHGGPLGTLAGDIGAAARLLLNQHLYASP